MLARVLASVHGDGAHRQYLTRRTAGLLGDHPLTLLTVHVHNAQKRQRLVPRLDLSLHHVLNLVGLEPDVEHGHLLRQRRGGEGLSPEDDRLSFGNLAKRVHERLILVIVHREHERVTGTEHVHLEGAVERRQPLRVDVDDVPIRLPQIVGPDRNAVAGIQSLGEHLVAVHREVRRVIVHVHLTETCGPQRHEPVELLIEIEHSKTVVHEGCLQVAAVHRLRKPRPGEPVHTHLRHDPLVHADQEGFTVDRGVILEMAAVDERFVDLLTNPVPLSVALHHMIPLSGLLFAQSMRPIIVWSLCHTVTPFSKIPLIV